MPFDKKWLKGKIKTLLYFLLFYSGLLHGFLLIFSRVKKDHAAIILLYHRLVDNHATSKFIYKGEVVHHNILDFKKEMSYIRKWFKVISLDELTTNLRNKKAFESPSIAITFDDGYNDNYALGYPILKELNLPATIYLTTGLTGTNDRTWPDEIEYALLHSNVDTFMLPELFGDESLNISSTEEKIKANSKIVEAMKLISNSKKLRLIDELFNRLKVKRDPDHNEERRMLNWEEAKEMSKNKISFAAHTHSHPILTQIALEEAKHEIALSKNIIEDKLGTPVKHFAFPNGRIYDFSEELRKYCMEIGFESIATAEYGAVTKKADPYLLLRVLPRTPLFMFAAEIARVFLTSRKYSKKGKYGTNK